MADLAVAVLAVGPIIVSRTVTGIVLMDDSPADGAGLLPAVVALLAQGRGVISSVFVPTDAGAAVGADHRGAGQTVRTEQLAVEFDELPSLKGVPAGIAAFIDFVHIVPPNNKMNPGHHPGLSPWYDMWLKLRGFTKAGDKPIGKYCPYISSVLFRKRGHGCVQQAVP